MNRQLFLAGGMLVLAGVAMDTMQKQAQQLLDAQQKLLRDVAADNMALRHYIHEKEVQENA